LDEENHDEQDTETTGQCHKRQKVQVEVTDDIVRGPDLFQNADIFYPHGDRNEIAKVIGRKQNDDGT
jgi:hypothetical protein